MIEEGVARIGRNESSNYSDIVHDRHIMDRLTERIERIERRLELNPITSIKPGFPGFMRFWNQVSD
jgi:hypothetical protein